jgi:hypothetical protein
MRPFQIFARMPADRALVFFRALSEQAPAAFAQCLALASAAMRARPVFLKRQPFERRAEAARRALARVASNDVAEEMLAVYFLECRKPLLVEWLDAASVEHEDGTLASDAPPEPPAEKLAEAVERYRKAGSAEDGADRELLLLAFASQRSVSWPALERMLEGGSSEGTPSP